MAAKFAGMRLNSDNIEYNRGRELLTGVTASVGRYGDLIPRSEDLQLTSSSSLSEVLGKTRRPDDIVLTLEGESFQWQVSVEPKRLEQAREFAAKVNAAARTFGPAYVAPPEPEREAAPDLVASLTGLAELHATGALSDDEFAAAKARLLR